MTHRFVVWSLGLFLCSVVSAQQLNFDDYFKEGKSFYKVNEQAIVRVINYYSEE